MLSLIQQSIGQWIMGIIIASLSFVLFCFRKTIKEYITFKCNKTKEKYFESIHQEITSLKQSSEKREDALNKQLQLVTKALLSSHYNTLLSKCKNYIIKNEIPADELEIVEDEYKIYKALGGNGHMEMWMQKVRELKII